ncbi:MAG TPA: polymer-forming cytoskeletal protein [Anaerolineales bacterium]|nr:polymer-forming cytoskeletal protein [Anaerolineales bacterium]
MKQQNNWLKIFMVAVVVCLMAILITQTTGIANLSARTGDLANQAHLAAGIASVAQPGLRLILEIESPGLPYQSRDGDRLVLGDNFTLESGETLNGSLVVLGGNVQVMDGSTVDGDIVVLGGSLVIHGVATGDVFLLAGVADIGPTAVIGGDVTSVSGNLRRDPGAQIDGDVNESITAPIPIPLPGIPGTSAVSPQVIVQDSLSIWDGLFFLFRSFMWATLAILVVLFFPKNTKRISDTVVSSPLIAGGLGMLTAIVAPIILVVVMITIIGIPFSLFGALVLAIAWAYGIVVIGVETGSRLGRLVNQDWALPVSAGIGTFLLTLVVNGVGEVIPCIGWLAPFLVGSIGLGATLLTVFGTRDYPVEMVSNTYTNVQPFFGNQPSFSSQLSVGKSDDSSSDEPSPDDTAADDASQAI